MGTAALFWLVFLTVRLWVPTAVGTYRLACSCVHRCTHR